MSIRKVRCPRCGGYSHPIEENYNPWYKCSKCGHEFKEGDK